jgi:signal transduction histidine kinase/ActR/RegA family two-component response regulator
MAASLLSRAGIDVQRCPNIQSVVTELESGAGALLLAEEALTDAGAGELIKAIAAQPPWSDLPVLVLARHGETSRAVVDAMDLSANVTVLERPMRVASLVSVVRSALRARQRQYELRAVLDGLRESDQRKTEFLATLAHELRNPLAPLSTSLAILTRKTPDREEAQRYYALMDRQVKHMVRLVNDLMEVSRVTRAQIDLQTDVVAINDLLREAVELSKPLMDAARHELRISAPTPSLKVRGDSVRLIQVFSNLLNNAAKYTTNQGRIDIVVNRAGNDVEIRVHDNGVGIPPDMLESVFGMFVQVHGTARAAQGGLGIGLTLVKNLVELHDGSVEASSDGEGQGTQILVRLPLLQEPEPARASSAPLQAIRVTDNILIVDDNRDAADSLAAVLELLGATTTVAYDGDDALDKAGQVEPSIAILDIGMPRMDGFELARRLREQPRLRNIALVALTGWGQSSDRQRIAAAGFDRHLLKPVDFSELASTLEQLAERPR